MIYEKLYKDRAFALDRTVSPNSLKELRKLRAEFEAFELMRGVRFLDGKIAHYEKVLLGFKFGREQQ